MQATGIERASVCMFWGKGMPSPQKEPEHDAALAMLRDATDLAKLVGGDQPKVIGPLHCTITEPGTLDMGVRFLKKAMPYAEEQGVDYADEFLRNEEDLVLDGEVGANELVDRVGSERLGVHVDAFHVRCLGRNQRCVLQSVGNRLKHVHASGHLRMVPGLDNVLSGEEGVKWMDVYLGLLDIKVRVDVVYEGFGPECVKEIPDIADPEFPAPVDVATAIGASRFTLTMNNIVAPLASLG